MRPVSVPFRRRRFLGVAFTPFDLEGAVNQIASRPPGAHFAFVVTPNAQHVVAASRGDQRFTEAQKRAWLILNDSRILRLIGDLLFGGGLPLATGADVAAELFRSKVRPDDHITIIGGSEELERRLIEAYGLRHVARLTPPMGFYNDPAQVEQCVRFVRDHPARYVFLVVGAPQSEMLALRLSEQADVTGIGLCFGSALNFLTGMIPRAPIEMRMANLEWLHRLAMNPRGHARRVFVDSPPILILAMREWWSMNFGRAPRSPV